MTLSKTIALHFEMKKVAQRISDEVYRRFYSYKTTIFLCGANADKTDSVREQVHHALLTGPHSYLYDIFRPEDLFEALISGPRHQDLISLENILADSVDAVVLAVESNGAIAELGVFAYSSNLRKKLVCLVDKRRKKDRSFINYGPLRLLKDTKQGRVIYVDFDKAAEQIESVRSAISQARRQGTKSEKVASVVQVHHFVLPCIYLFEPVEFDTLSQLVRDASDADDCRSRALTAGALAMLGRNREVEMSPSGYKLSPAGLAQFAALQRRGKTGYATNIRAMDDLRAAILNWQYRGKDLNIH